MKTLILSICFFSQFTFAQSNANPSLHGQLNDTTPPTVPMRTPKKYAKDKSHAKGQTDSTRSDLDHSTDSPITNPSQQPVIDQH